MLLTGAILFLMWDQFLRLVLRQVMAAFELDTVYFFALWFLREAVWWWVVSILLAILADLLVTVNAGESAGGDQLAPAAAE
jgi:hypothetical protein